MPKGYRRGAKMKAEINKAVQWNNETKGRFFKTIKKMDQALATLINEKREMT